MHNLVEDAKRRRTVFAACLYVNFSPSYSVLKIGRARVLIMCKERGSATRLSYFLARGWCGI